VNEVNVEIAAVIAEQSTVTEDFLRRTGLSIA
jgi:hypothetical protein